MRFLLLRKGIIATSLLLIVACGAKETKTTDSSLGGLFPSGAELSGYTQTSSPISYDRGKAWDYLGAEADRFLYNGFELGARAQYSTSDKARSLTVDVLEFSDPVRAFALYAHLRMPSAKTVALNPRGYLGNDTLVFVKGNHLGRIINTSSGGEDDQIAAAKVVLGKLSDSSMLPPQVLAFPKEGQIPITETVTLDDINGQTWDSNLFGVKYLHGADTLAVYLRLETVDGPTVAVKRFIGDKGKIKSYLMDCGYQAMTATNEQGLLVFCAVDKGVLCTVIGRIDEAVAKEKVNQVFALAAQLGLK